MKIIIIGLFFLLFTQSFSFSESVVNTNIISQTNTVADNNFITVASTCGIMGFAVYGWSVPYLITLIYPGMPNGIPTYLISSLSCSLLPMVVLYPLEMNKPFSDAQCEAYRFGSFLGVLHGAILPGLFGASPNLSMFSPVTIDIMTILEASMGVYLTGLYPMTGGAVVWSTYCSGIGALSGILLYSLTHFTALPHWYIAIGSFAGLAAGIWLSTLDNITYGDNLMMEIPGLVTIFNLSFSIFSQAGNFLTFYDNYTSSSMGIYYTLLTAYGIVSPVLSWLLVKDHDFTLEQGYITAAFSLLTSVGFDFLFSTIMPYNKVHPGYAIAMILGTSIGFAVPYFMFENSARVSKKGDNSFDFHIYPDSLLMALMEKKNASGIPDNYPIMKLSYRF